MRNSRLDDDDHISEGGLVMTFVEGVDGGGGARGGGGWNTMPLLINLWLISLSIVSHT